MKIDFPCPICASKEYKVVLEDTIGDKYPEFGYDFSPKHNLAYRIVECKNCTHAYASPRHENIWAQYQDIADDNYLQNVEQYTNTFEKVVSKLVEHKDKGSLLDVGCSTGIFLKVAQKHYEVEGLELSSWAVKIARQNGLTIHECLLENMPTDKKYDIITMWGVIEHLEYPDRELKYISNLLKPNGIVCFWTGDISSVPANILGRKWWYVQGQHIQMFTEKSITKLFENNGFKNEYMGWYPYVMTMRSINKSLARYPLLHALSKPFLTNSFMKERKLVIKLPGEMFGIFRKK